MSKLSNFKLRFKSKKRLKTELTIIAGYGGKNWGYRETGLYMADFGYRCEAIDLEQESSYYKTYLLNMTENDVCDYKANDININNTGLDIRSYNINNYIYDIQNRKIEFDSLDIYKKIERGEPYVQNITHSLFLAGYHDMRHAGEMVRQNGGVGESWVLVEPKRRRRGYIWYIKLNRFYIGGYGWYSSPCVYQLTSWKISSLGFCSLLEFDKCWNNNNLETLFIGKKLTY